MASSPDGIDLLLSFHEQVRVCFRRLREVEENLKQRDSDSLEAAETVSAEVLAFLEAETPLHEKDEALSFFPRLRAAVERAGETDSQLLAALSEVEAQHDSASEVWEPVRVWLWRITSPGAIISIDRFHEAIEELEKLFLTHFELEERVLYSTARRLFTADDVDELAQEIRGRRPGGRVGSTTSMGS